MIPARFASTRLPGKPLADIHGKPMIQHVYERVMSAQGLDKVVVATDDQRIVDAVQEFGGEVLLTSAAHASGTDRLAEVQQSIPADVYLNVQGDEPLVDPLHLNELIAAISSDPQAGMATLCHPICDAEADNPNAVKVVVSSKGYALYFSRAKVPFLRDKNSKADYLKHVGVYAFRADVLAAFNTLPPSKLESTELLEQLRLVESGIPIRMVQVKSAAPGVDTPACLDRVRRIIAGEPEPERKSLADIQLIITDVDGVLTDGSIWYDDTGECLKRFHVRDGMGIKMLQEAGVEVAVVSGRDSPSLRMRLKDLGIFSFLLGVKDKAQACRDIMKKHQVTAKVTACIGDDSIDLPAFTECDWPVAVADAADYVKSNAVLVLSKNGGNGAFREFSDAVLSAKQQDNIFNSVIGYQAAMNRLSQ